MTMQFAIVGIAAGAAAALLFASVTSGVWLSIPLFYLAPLPIMIAGLGWGHWAALIAAVVGSLSVAIIFGSVFALAFITSTGVPAWWLGYLAMLARPAAGSPGKIPGGSELEWYPAGHLVIWAAVLAAIVVIAAIPNFGLDTDSFRAGLRNALSAILQVDAHSTPATSLTTDRLIEFLIGAIPPAAAVLATITNLLNLWMAGRIVQFSGRLARPWPAISDMVFPTSLTFALAAAVALSFLDGMIGIIGGIISASLLLAYGVLGFAVLHQITLGMSMRGLIIGFVYGAVLVLGWPILALCLLGVVESGFGLRARIARHGGKNLRE
ncbi:MAG TPA: DUF2232 domain-containing protein [Pseudolabrys sp.]|nr:DUF2232 domain-containing protein [Pseudolabrys sp.]